jgi:hypothetical protein
LYILLLGILNPRCTIDWGQLKDAIFVGHSYEGFLDTEIGLFPMPEEPDKFYKILNEIMKKGKNH